MANMAEIEFLSKKEVLDLSEYINQIRDAIKNHKNGVDITINRAFISKLEEECDRLEIPFYWVGEDTVSVAATYTQLLNHERSR